MAEGLTRKTCKHIETKQEKFYQLIKKDNLKLLWDEWKQTYNTPKIIECKKSVLKANSKL